MAAKETYDRFVDLVAHNLVALGVGAQPDPALAEAAIEAVRRAVNRKITNVYPPCEPVWVKTPQPDTGKAIDQ